MLLALPECGLWFWGRQDRSVEITDAFLSAYAVLFFQHPFPKAMKEKRKRNNVETLMGAKDIPCDNEIRTLIDPIEPSRFRRVFDQGFQGLRIADS